MTLVALAVAPAYPRVCSAPPLEPPYDDEPGPRLRLLPPHVEEQLPFELTGPAVLADADADADADAGDPFDRRPTPRSELPDPGAWAGRLIQATLEAFAGRRSVQQLMPWTDEVVYAQVSRAVRRRAGKVPGLLRSLHVSEPAEGVVEVCAVVSGSGRCRAVAARLEGSDGRWRCTALKLI